MLTGSKDGRENPGSRLPHSPSSDGLWIEAEEESAFRITSPHSGQRAEISHSGQSYWSLYGEGDWVEYQIQIPRDQMYYIWVRYSEDSQHQPSKKGITVSLDGIALDTIRPPAHTARDQWRWYRAGWGFIRGDRHALRITRFPFTQAPALIDAIFITTDGSILSPKLASHETESSG